MMPQEIFHKGRQEAYFTDDYTHEAYWHLWQNYAAGLFLEMSLGKTLVTATYIHDMLYQEAAFSRVLIIAPPKVAGHTWPSELDGWQHLEGMRYALATGTEPQRVKAFKSDADIIIMSTGAITWLEQTFWSKRTKKWKGITGFDCVVIDEGSMFKNQSSERYKSLARFIKHIGNRIMLTGTPTPNGLHEMWALINLLDDGKRLGTAEGHFIAEHFTTRGDGMVVFEYKPRPKAMQRITEAVADIVLTMKTEDYLELPEVHYRDEVMTFGAYDREVYDELEREMCLDFFGTDKDVMVKTAADLSNKLLQLSGGAMYDNDKEWHPMNDVKLEKLLDILHWLESPCIVAYQYRHELDRIKQAVPHAEQLGTTPNTLKSSIERWNKGEIKVLLLHPASAGHGLNLQFGGSDLIWFSPTWNLEHWLQTNARVIRRGAKYKITVWRLLIKGTRDMKVAKRIESKDSNQAFLMGEIKALRAKYG